MELLAIFGSAFFFGLVSSGHCTLMCGPIQSAWLVGADAKLVVRYHLGRLGAYLVIALVIRLVFSQLTWFVDTANLTLMLGISMFFGALFYFIIEYLLPASISKPFLTLGAWAGAFAITPRMWLFGVINGLLPCGMVWMAAGMGSAFDSNVAIVGIITAFWVGTLPALLGLNLVVRRLYGMLAFTGSKRWVVPAAMLVIGLTLSYRGIVYGNNWLKSTPNEAMQQCAPMP